MLISYEKAFALRDNPFRPTQILEGVKNFSMMQELDSRPLRIHKEPKLFSLYCEKAGPFESLVHEFQDRIAQEGYRINPPSAGFNPFIFLIVGSKGTGKTTLANTMIHHLEQCKSNNLKWHVKDPWSNKEFSSSGDQIAEIDKLQAELCRETQEGDYCCILIDNLVEGAEVRALEMFDELGKDRIVFLFLLTSDLQISKKFTCNSKHQLLPFVTRQLTPDDAIAFAKCRIDFYRRQSELSFLGNYNLFPFDADDIRDAVKSGAIKEDEEGKITIRMLGVVLNNCIAYRMRELDETFDISKLSDDDITNNVIRLVDYYKRIVDKRKVV